MSIYEIVLAYAQYLGAAFCMLYAGYTGNALLWCEASMAFSLVMIATHIVTQRKN